MNCEACGHTISTEDVRLTIYVPFMWVKFSCPECGASHHGILDQSEFGVEEIPEEDGEE